MATALIAVDVQTDFLPGGALAVPNGLEVIRPLTSIARDELCDLFVATRDWHPSDHRSFSLEPEYKDGSWPPHCVQHTKGAEIDPEILIMADAIISKGFVNATEAYSGFDGRDLAADLTLEHILRRKEVTKVIVGGLALDYCVRATALDAHAKGFDTIVAIDATRPVDFITGAMAVADLTRQGVEVQNFGYWDR